ncbi:PrsW family intramembrane metalloprotease [Clostridium massiliodielmoense]|uniref:PrsW family intramembrane metalloprotease n=1 Tax=Clostridium massiliodielmoense TaxID=1776385 RepID=UPI000166A3C1|nr:PrsW family glutamic-type intramembrane protease [Clostridium massiliodielmoense]EDS78605.1 putative membrane protein [Clostridium botulinum C str. Eklund]KEH97981.1 peptidase [Clostridium botulinum C/D str. BKT12695]NEZ49985.1 PrsW family intramembrane metalloprotease [Clostridium botulinum]
MSNKLFIIAVIPGIVLAILIYLVDRYDKEPIKTLIKVLILGAISVIPTILVEKFLVSLNYFSGLLKIVFNAFIIAGLTEEFFKREVVLRSVFKKQVFNEKLDGIIYCSFSALGFATVENIMYVVFDVSPSYYVGLYRGIFSVPAHLLFAVTMGYYISLSKFSNNRDLKKKFLKKSLLVPAVFHGIFDFILMSQNMFLAILFLPFVAYLWLINLKKLNKYYLESKKENELKSVK